VTRKLLLGALATLILCLVGLGSGSRTASAEVVQEYWLPITAPSPLINLVNAYHCPDQTTPISLTGMAHYVWYTTPEGTLKMNISGHATGTGADGTEYIVNVTRKMEHVNWPASLFPYTDHWTTRLVSKGSTDNAEIVLTVDPAGSATAISVTACRG